MSEGRLTEIRPGLWIDEGVVSIPSGDSVADAERNMERATRDYSFPQKVILGRWA